MSVVEKYPCGGGANQNIENAGQPHLLCAVLVDTSGSMSPVSDQLHQSLTDLVAAMTDRVTETVELCVIGFDDEARILTPFTPAYDYKAPHIDCGGMTAMHAAVDLGLSELEARKKLYKANYMPYYRPWMFLLTDGRPNDPDNGAFDRLLEAQRDRHCTFFPVAIGDEADKDLLKSLKTDGKILTASKENFWGMFAWLGERDVPCMQPVDPVRLPDPRDYIMEIEA